MKKIPLVLALFLLFTAQEAITRFVSAADFARPKTFAEIPAARSSGAVAPNGNTASSAAGTTAGNTDAASPGGTGAFNDRVAEFNPEIRYLKNELASCEKAFESEAKDLPLLLEAEGEKLTGSDSGEKNYTTKNLELSKSFELGRGPGIKKSRSRLEFEIKKYEIDRGINDVLYEANIAALRLVKLCYLKKLSDGNRAIASGTIDAVTKKYEVSLASRMEIEQAQIDYEVQVLKNMEAAGAFESEKKVFAVKNGRSGVAFIDRFLEGFERTGLTGEIALLGKNTGIAISGCGALYEEALKKRLDRMSAAAEARLCKVLIDLESRSNSPELKLGMFRSVNDSGETERGMRFGVVVPIYDFGRRSSSVEALKIRLYGPGSSGEAVDFNLANVDNRILADITEKYDACVLQREKLKMLSGVVLNRASAIFEMAAVGYREGATSLFEYQTAKKNYFEFYEGLISASIDYNISLLCLRKACGVSPRGNDDIMDAFFDKRN